ncbi:MAG: hypothetical protein FWD69_19185 [Polyangiaceae bacterium]|nr:hypothetical protein [Polyangiaceae bacterium]
MNDATQTPNDAESFRRAKRLFVIAAAGIVLGLAMSGSFDRTAGGVLLCASWVLGVIALHRLGRSGRDAEGAP